MTTDTYHCHHCGAVPAENRCTVCGALCCFRCVYVSERAICAECWLNEAAARARRQLIEDEECDE